MSKVTLLTGDCRNLMPGIPTGSVDSIVTDPPYPCIKRPYGTWTEAEWFALMDVVVPECRRVLKPTGSAVLVLQPTTERIGRMRTWLWEFLAKWGREWGIVQDAYWHNPNALPGAQAIQGRLMRPAVKTVVWLGNPDCYRNQDAVLAPVSKRHATRMRRFADTASSGRVSLPSGQGVDEARATKRAAERGGTCPFNVVACNHGRGQDSAGAMGHGAGTPLDLCSWWVRYITPPGGTVLDPFSGTATVGDAAQKHGCDYIGIERMPEYQAIAAKRHGVEVPVPTDAVAG